MSTLSTTVISANAFKNNTMLRTAKANSVLSVGDMAFKGCYNIDSVEISSCTDIRESAFEGCSNVKTVRTDKCRNIGDYAFAGCAELVKVDPENVSSIGNYAFQECDNLNISSFPNCLSIGHRAFYRTGVCGQTSDCTFPCHFPKCEYIGDYAFALVGYNYGDSTNKKYAANVLSLYFPKCRKIGKSAFDTQGLYSNEKSYGLYPNLSTLYFPECTEILSCAFVQKYSNNQYSKNSKSFFKSLTSLHFPSCQYIGDSAFEYFAYNSYLTGTENNNMKTIDFPECLEIGSKAFRLNQNNDRAYRYTDNISSISFLKCEKISSYAFENFYTGEKLDMNLSSCLSIYEGVFKGSNFIKSLNLNRCKTIQSNILNASTTLISCISLPDIEFIGNNNFYNMIDSNLTSVSFGSRLSSLGTCNFHGLNNRVVLSIDENNSYFEVDKDRNIIYSKAENDYNRKGLIEAYLYNDSVHEYENDIKYIREYAAYECSNIVEIKTTPQCTEIGRYAYCGCNKLQTICDDDRNSAFPSVKTVGEYAFYNTNISGAISFPECLSVSEFAFSKTDNDNTKMKNLQSISLPKCRYVGKYAFSNNTDIDRRGYYSYSQVNLESCLSIGYRAFTSIKQDVNCYIRLGSTIPTLIKADGNPDDPKNVTKYIGSKITLQVPSGKLADYQTAFGVANYTFEAYTEETTPSFRGYHYLSAYPQDNQATILKMTDSNKMLTKNAVIPETISQE